jgi:hypothetical protein
MELSNAKQAAIDSTSTTSVSPSNKSACACASATLLLLNQRLVGCIHQLNPPPKADLVTRLLIRKACRIRVVRTALRIHPAHCTAARPSWKMRRESLLLQVGQSPWLKCEQQACGCSLAGSSSRDDSLDDSAMIFGRRHPSEASRIGHPLLKLLVLGARK